LLLVVAIGQDGRCMEHREKDCRRELHSLPPARPLLIIC
jgi:hypothetical protein